MVRAKGTPAKVTREVTHDDPPMSPATVSRLTERLKELEMVHWDLCDGEIDRDLEKQLDATERLAEGFKPLTELPGHYEFWSTRLKNLRQAIGLPAEPRPPPKQPRPREGGASRSDEPPAVRQRSASGDGGGGSTAAAHSSAPATAAPAVAAPRPSSAAARPPARSAL